MASMAIFEADLQRHVELGEDVPRTSKLAMLLELRDAGTSGMWNSTHQALHWAMTQDWLDVRPTSQNSAFVVRIKEEAESTKDVHLALLIQAELDAESHIHGEDYV